jgi:O-antigen/teichoic acid export membrane protein
LTLLNLVIGFVATPLLLKYLGHEDYSLFKISYDWLASIGFLEQILTASALSMLANLSDDNRDHYTHYTFKKFVKISVIFLLLSMFVTPFLPYLFKIPINKIDEVKIGFIVGTFGFIFLPITILRTWIEFHEKSYLLNIVRSLQNLIQISIAIIFAYFAFGIIGQYLSFLIGQFIFAIFVYWFFKKTHQKKEYQISTYDLQEFDKTLRKNNLTGFILSISSKLSFLSDTLILGFFFKPIDILPFSLTQKLTQMVQENLQTLGNSSWATLANLHRNGQSEEFEKMLFSLTRVTIFLSIILTAPLMFLNHSFITLWVGEKFYAGDLLTTIAIVNTYLMGIYSLWGWCLSGSGKIKIQIPIYAINAIINFLTALIFIKWIGISGPIIGTLIGFLSAYLILIPRALEKEFNISANKLRATIIFPLFYLLIPFILNYYYKNLFMIDNFIRLIIYYLTIMLIFSLVMAISFLSANERKYLLNLVFNKLQIKKSTR